jgi:O-antigen ligase
MNVWLARAAGWLPALFWAAYVLWNAILTTPPVWGRLTPFTLIYLLMLPATLLMAWRVRRTPMDGQWAYVAFLVWLIIGVLWRGTAVRPDIVKALFVCALGLPIAAQVIAGGAAAGVTFAASVALTGVAISAMTIGQALASGFRYRTGTLVNQNFLATMVAPGLLIALVFYLWRRDDAARRALLALVLICTYAIMLLGSRGVLVAVFVATVVTFRQIRPSLRRVRGLAVGLVTVVTIAQLPVIPHALWEAGSRTVSSVRAAAPWFAASPAPAAPNDKRTGGAQPLNPDAATSNAIARFVELDTGTLNRRTGLWTALAVYIVTKPSVLLFGGGLDASGEVAHRADARFSDAHNVYLQLLADAGLVGTGLLVWTVWSVMRRLSAAGGAAAYVWVPLLVFWSVNGLTITVTDLHVFWCTLGVAMAATVTATEHVGSAPPPVARL